MFRDLFLLEQEEGEPLRAERLPIGETEGRDEAWLRDTLFRHPDILPIREIDPAYAPLTPLCTEMRTSAGRVDAAFINPFGRLTLLECKLWRNPQARREVVAQVLHYAQAISRWTYADLQREVTAAARDAGEATQDNVPFDLVRDRHGELAEQEFVDATAAAMRRGKFLLLIAGDGMHEDVGAMAELINSNAALGFSLGLVEVALYGFPDGAVAVQPRIIAKTRIIERTVVLVQSEAGAEEHIEDPTLEAAAADNDNGALVEAQRQWWQPILGRQFDDRDQPPPRFYYPNHVRVFLPWPRVWLLAGNLRTRRLASVSLVEGGHVDDKTLLPLLLARQEEIFRQLPEGARLEGPGGRWFEVTRDWAEFESEDEKKEWIAQTLNAYVNVFRPLLGELADE